MSIFSVLGSIGKTVGKAALGTVGGVLNTATGGLTGGIVNANMFDSKPTAVAPAPVAQAATPVVVQQTGTFGDAVKGLVNGLTSLVTGQTHAQVDVHTQIGGTNDPNVVQNSQFPPWLLPVGLAVGAFMLLKPNGRR